MFHIKFETTNAVVSVHTKTVKSKTLSVQWFADTSYIIAIPDTTGDFIYIIYTCIIIYEIYYSINMVNTILV